MINCPVIYGFVEKRGIDLRNNFHLKFKEWKDKKKYSRKSIDGLFSKSEGSPPTPVAHKKRFLQIKFLKGKKIGRLRKTKRDGRKKQKSKKKELRRKVAAKNKELKKTKKAKKEREHKKEL